MNLLAFLRGSCSFTANGVFPERFINLASRADLGLWDIRRSENGLTASIIASRYKKLLPIARKCGVRLRVSKKSGLPFRLIPYRRRAGMPLGLIVFCCIIWALSRFVWIVDIPQVSPELQPALEAAIYDLGVRPGVLRSSLNAKMLSNELQLDVRELSWAGISTNGSHVTVDVREMIRVEKKVDSNQPCNIVASKSGVIISVNAAEGRSVVTAGQTVAEGDMLITGVLDFNGGIVSMVHAQGEVTAKTFYQLTSKVPFSQQRPERTGRVVTIRRLMLLGFEVPLYFRADLDGTFEREYEEWQLTVGKSRLPLNLRTEKWYELRTVNREIDALEAEQIARKDIENQLLALGNIEILETNEAFEQTETGVELTLTVTAKENIALSELILFESH